MLCFQSRTFQLHPYGSIIVNINQFTSLELRISCRQCDEDILLRSEDVYSVVAHYTYGVLNTGTLDRSLSQMVPNAADIQTKRV